MAVKFALILTLLASMACASPRFTCDRNGFKLDGKPFTPVGAAYAVVTDVDFSAKYNVSLVEKDLGICQDLNMNTLLVFVDYKSFEPKDDQWDDSYTAHVDDFIERAYKRGIYIAILNVNWWTGFEFAKLSQPEIAAPSDQRYTNRLLMDEMVKWTKEFLKRLRNRDKLFAWTIFCEPATNAWAGETQSIKPGFMSEYVKTGLMRRWHDYLRRKYGAFEKLRASWSLGGRIEAIRPEETDFDTIRPAFEGDIHYYTPKEYPRSWRRSEDYQRFLAEEYTRNTNLLSDAVKSVAPHLLTCNSLLPVLLPVIRSWKWSVPEAHHGIAYNERLIEPRVRTDFTAIRFSPDMDSWSESLSPPNVPIEYKLQFGLPAAIWYLKHSLDAANKPLMFFDLDNADFGDWIPEMMRTYTSQELPLAAFAGSKGYMWWCYKTNKIVKAPYGLVEDDRTPTSRYNVAKDFNAWVRRTTVRPSAPQVTVILNEADTLVNPWDTWASIEALAASMMSRGASYEVMTVREFLAGPKTRDRVIWLRNGFADASPDSPELRRLMEDPSKRVVVIGADWFLSTESSGGRPDILDSSVNVFRRGAGTMTVRDIAFLPKPPLSPTDMSLHPISNPASIPTKYGTLCAGGTRLVQGVGLAVAKVGLPARGELFPTMQDSDGNPIVIGDRKAPGKHLVLLQTQALWYRYDEPGALDLIPDLLGLPGKLLSRGLFSLNSKGGEFLFRPFGDPGPGVSGLTSDRDGRLVETRAPLGVGEVRILGKQ